MTPDDVKQRTADVYNMAADHFDDAPLAFWDKYGRRTVERLDLPRGANVLDVGCGTGASALPAARIVGPTGHVLGVDLAENLLEIARRKSAAQKIFHTTFQHGDMEHLGFPDAHFDAVVSVFNIFFVPNMEALVAELWRMVKPDGKLAITTWGRDIFAPVYDVWNEAANAEQAGIVSEFNPWDRIVTPEAVTKMMIDGGVPHPEVVPENGAQPLWQPEDVWTIMLGSGLRGTIDVLGDEKAARVRDKLVRYVQANQVRAVTTHVIYAVGTK